MSRRELRRKKQQLEKREEKRANKPQRVISKENYIRQLREVSLTKHTIEAVRTHLPDDIHSVIVPFVRFNQPQFNKYTTNITPRMTNLFKKYHLADIAYLCDLLRTIPEDKLVKYVRRGSAKIYYKKCYGTSIYLKNKGESDEWEKLFEYRWDLSCFMRDLHKSITTDQSEYSETFPNSFSVEERARMLENLLLSFIFVHRKYSTVPLADYF